MPPKAPRRLPPEMVDPFASRRELLSDRLQPNGDFTQRSLPNSVASRIWHLKQTEAVRGVCSHGPAAASNFGRGAFKRKREWGVHAVERQLLALRQQCGGKRCGNGIGQKAVTCLLRVGSISATG